MFYSHAAFVFVVRFFLLISFTSSQLELCVCNMLAELSGRCCCCCVFSATSRLFLSNNCVHFILILIIRSFFSLFKLKFYNRFCFYFQLHFYCLLLRKMDRSAPTDPNGRKKYNLLVVRYKNDL